MTDYSVLELEQDQFWQAFKAGYIAGHEGHFVEFGRDGQPVISATLVGLFQEWLDGDR